MQGDPVRELAGPAMLALREDVARLVDALLDPEVGAGRCAILAAELRQHAEDLADGQRAELAGEYGASA